MLALGYLSRTQSMPARTRLLRAILEADDPLADLLPRGALLVAAALPEMEHAPPAIVAETARRLLEAYAARDVDWLRKEVTAAFARLRRGDQAHLVDRALVEALTTPPPEGSPNLAPAAAAIIREHEWFTPDLADALLTALPRDVPEEAFPITRTLADLAAVKPEALPAARLPFRRALLAEPTLAARVQADPDWLALTLALYGGLDEQGNFHPRHIHRDSPLTPDLLEALRQGRPPDDLLPRLREKAAATDESLQADAHIALALLEGVETVSKSATSGTVRRWSAARAAFLRPVVRARANEIARALAALAPHLAEPERRRALAQALQAAADIPDSDARARALAALAPHLAGQPDLLAQALQAAADIPDDIFGNRAEALAALAPHLAEPERRRALDLALQAARTLAAPQLAFHALAALAEPALAPTDDPAALWSALAAALHSQESAAVERLVERLTAQGLEKGWACTPEALSTVEALAAHRPDLAAALLPLLQTPAPALLPQVETWLRRPEPELARHAALLLAEAGRLTPETLPLLVDLLRRGPDRSRYRAALALYGRRYRIAALGRETVEALAALGQEHHAEPQVGTVLFWTLREIVHDDPDTLEAWAQALAAGESPQAEVILGRIHHLTPETWPVFHRWLTAGPPAVQATLLHSLAWLLRLEELPPAARPEARAALHALLASEAANVRLAAVEALGHLPAPQEADWQALLPLTANSAREALVVTRALARLGSRLEKEARAPVAEVLQAALGDPLLRPAAAGGLVRLWLADEWGDPDAFDPTPLLDRLLGGGAGELRLSPRAALEALLTAGEDDDVWHRYHERVVRAARALVVAQPDETFEPLLAHLETALTTSDADDWPPRRIALAVTAAVAEALPGHFRRRADPARHERLLVQAAKDAESFSTRRFALTALSHLRRVTPAVAQALLAALRDVGRVQQDALAAAERFRLAEGEIVSVLAAALRDESAATAYAAAQVLAALGRSREAAHSHQAIVTALADAIRDPHSRRPVYVLEGEKIKYLGQLDELLYRALVGVVGVAAGKTG